MKKIIAKTLMRFHGWTVDEKVPQEANYCVMLAMPHTTNWDFYYMILAFWVLEIPLKFTIKSEWTRFPFGLITKPLGAIGINRSPKVKDKKQSYVENMVEIFKQHQRIAVVVTPEGTRKLNKQWKRGFYYTALGANVPITFGYLDYENKAAGVSMTVLHPTGDIAQDFQVLNGVYRNIKGKFPENFSLDERYDLEQQVEG